MKMYFGTYNPLCKLYLILKKEISFNSFKQLQVKFVYNEVQIKVCSFELVFSTAITHNFLFLDCKSNKSKLNLEQSV